MIHVIENDISLLIYWLDNNDIYFIDTETRRKNLSNLKMDYYDTEVIMLQIGDKYNQYIIDTRTTNVEFLKKYLEDPKKLKVGHNIKYDYCVIKVNFDIVMENVYDTMIVDQLIYNGLDYKYSLEEVVYRHTGINPYSNQLSLFDPFIPKSSRNDISKKKTESFTAAEIFYGATDLISTNRVFDKQLLLIEDMKELVDLENDFVLVVGDMELNGIPINVDKWLDLEEDNLQKLSEIESKLLAVAEINWNSSKQVLEVFKKLNIPVEIFDHKTGEIKESVNATSFTDKIKNDYPIIRTYIQYKEFKKAVSSYGSKFLTKVNPVTNRLHTNIIQILHTGRTASSNPNVQNIPREQEFRECFESDEYLIGCDFSNQEMHILANKSLDKTLIDGFNNGLDMHKLTGANAFDIPYEECDGTQRHVGKTINFGVVYGIGPSKIAKQFELSLGKSKTLIKNYYKNYTGLAPFFEECHKEVLTTGVITIDELGRKYTSSEFDRYKLLKSFKDIAYYPELYSELGILESKLKRLSQNYKIQGTAASMSKLAGVLLRKAAKGVFRIILLVHDEWIIESNNPEQSSTILKECMSEASKRFVKLTTIKTDTSITKYWKK